MTHDHKFHAGETVCLTEEFPRITDVHDPLQIVAKSKQSDGDGARYTAFNPQSDFVATLPDYALHGG